MSNWFIRCNGETAHNRPGTERHMPGEPPGFPNRQFNYRDDCVRKGFARVGWPGVGDLRASGWRTQAQNTYGDMIKAHHLKFLEQFRSVNPGDLVLLPTYQRRYDVHIGVVVPPRDATKRVGSGAYYYFFDIPAREWYETAHRVDVEWAKDSSGGVRSFDVLEIGGTWIRGFGQVKSGYGRIVQLARNAGLLR